MKKIFVFTAALLLPAGFVCAQNKTAAADTALSLQRVRVTAEALGFGGMNGGKEIKNQSEDFKKYTAMCEEARKTAEDQTNAALKTGFDNFTGRNPDHKKPHYKTMADYMALLAGSKIFGAGISFMDGKEFKQAYGGYDEYDFYRGSYHKTDNVTNTRVSNYAWLVLLVNGKPFMSVSFIEHTYELGGRLYVHEWDIVRQVNGKDVPDALVSKNMFPDDKNATGRLRRQLIKDGGLYNTAF